MLYAAVECAVFEPYMDAVAGSDGVCISDDRAGLVSCYGKAAGKHPQRTHCFQRGNKTDVFLPFSEKQMFFRRVQTVGKPIHVHPPVLQKSRWAFHNRSGGQIAKPGGERFELFPLGLLQPLFQRLR